MIKERVMFECPNCGGNLRFDIPSQQLACDFCHTFHDPYAVTKDHDAVEQDMYDVTVFTCPQCGCELMSTENSAAEFCTFCGASTILSGRISKEKRPNYIIPFKKTKDDCKDAYAKFVKHAIFAPKELKDPKYLDRFRGIYMPYWAYYISQNSGLSLEGTKQYRRGNYIYTDTYHLSGNMRSYYKGLSYDASSSFSDEISQNIAPYDVKGMKAFTPSYLSGFYADTADVDCSLYQDDAVRIANETSYEKLSKEPAFHGMHISTPVNSFSLSSAFGTKLEQTDSAMFPVWFLSYRNGSRVSYATVNGQTGKIAADLPVDIRKYFLGSLILALPIFLLLNIFFTIRPTTTLMLSSILALAAAIIYVVELFQIKKKDAREDDLGYLAKKDGVNSPGVMENMKQQHDYKKAKRNGKKFTGTTLVLLFIAAYGILAIGGSIFAVSGTFFGHSVIGYFVILIAAAATTSIGCTISAKAEIKHGATGFSGSIAAILISAVITAFHPVSDLYYYAGTIFSYIATFFTLYSIIQKYNVLASRKLPQFEKRGGEEYENR